MDIDSDSSDEEIMVAFYYLRRNELRRRFLVHPYPERNFPRRSFVAAGKLNENSKNEQKVNIKFVGEVEKHPVLFNFTLPGYKRKDETEKAWSEVGKVVDMTVAECKEKWKNLRTVFVRNMKTAKSDAGAKTKKTYYLLENMQFTVPYIKALAVPSGNLPNQNPPEQEEDERLDEIDFNTTEQDLEPSLSFQQLPPSTELSPTPLYTTSTTDTPQINKNTTQNQSEPSHVLNKKRGLKNEAADKAFLEYFQAKKSKTMSSLNCVNQDPKTESLKMFLLSMLPDLLKMTDEQVQLFKRRALLTIDEILSNQVESKKLRKLL